jgi:lysophospholipase L1-like esterase
MRSIADSMPKGASYKSKQRMRLILRMLVLAAVILATVFFQHRYDSKVTPTASTPKHNAIPGSEMCSSTAIRVACMGDSITRGDASHEEDQLTSKKSLFKDRGNYPKMLQSMLGPRFDVRNFGRGGATACSASGAAYIDTPHYPAALEFKPHIAVIMLGTNDAKADLWEGTKCGGRPAFQSGLEQILSGIADSASKLKSTQPLIVLVPPPPILSDGTFQITLKFLPDIRDEIRSRGSEAATCDAIHGNVVTPELPIPVATTMYMRDGIHLNHNGTLRLACVVFNELMGHCQEGWEDCLGSIQNAWQAGETQCKELLNSAR